MQRDTTLQFWDEYHNENDSQEWISKPGEELLAMIFHHYWNQDQDHRHRHTSNIQVNNNNNNNNNNNDALTNDIVKNNDEIIKLLEIGCGTSTLVRDMKIHIENTYYYPRIIKTVIACGTDVSQVCIDVNQQRDGHNSGDLWYEVLNCLEEDNNGNDNGEQLSSSSSSSFHHRGNWDLIIDKGCLDTFMFRSKKQGTNRIYPESVRKLLDNIHGWLLSSTKSSPSSSSSLSTSLSLSSSDDGGERLEKEEEELVVRNRRVGCYIFISPRSKVKAVRDYAGFSSVRRYPLPGNYRAELEGKKNNINNRSNNNNNNNNENNNENNSNITRDDVDDSNITSPPSSTPGYLFVCTKNINYKVGIEEPFPTAAATDHHGGDQNEKLNDDTKCPKCGISFLEFRKGEGVEFRGNKFWTRTFKGHCIHCN